MGQLGFFFYQKKLLKIVNSIHFIFLIVGSIVASMPSFSFLKSVILAIPVGFVGGVVGELRNKTKLQPSSIEVELWLSLAINKVSPICW